MASKSTAAEIWETLSRVDVSEHIETKNGLSYLSWAWAWGTLMEYYPEAEFEFIKHTSEGGSITDILEYKDGSASVQCKITIPGKLDTDKKILGSVTRQMWLPVMDYRNKAITNPDSRSISDSKMRCLVKCIAILGLGHYIYAGEDLPESTTVETNKTPKKKLNGKNSKKEEQEKATKTVTMAYEVFAKECESLDDLKEFWRSNKDNLSDLEKSEPEIYRSILEVFSSKKKELSN